MKEISSTWHLAQTEDEKNVTEFELQLWRVFNGFLRWVEECEKMVNHTKLDGFDLSVLHIVRMNDRPKSIADIGKLLNRMDNFNLQYSIKKLIKMDLIKKIEESPYYVKSTLYEITEAGVKNTNAYTEARRKILIDMFIKNADLTLADMTKTISRLKAIYDEAEQAAALYLSATPKPIKEVKPKKAQKKNKKS